ncbi:MAG: DUF928 domain-containing protein [Hormoscilla sp.]
MRVLKNHKQAMIRKGVASFLGLLVCSWPAGILAGPLNLPEDVGLPGRREGGGTRGECLRGRKLTAIMPKSNTGKTISEYPTFFVYVPESLQGWANTVKGAEFGIEDENGNEIYSKEVTLPSDYGIVSVSIPSTPDAPKLEVGKHYTWYFHVICDWENNPLDRSSIHYVESGIQRVEPSDELVRGLRQKSARDRVDMYGEEGMWFDLVATLAELRRTHSEDLLLAAEWARLFRHDLVQLYDLAEEPLVNCCTSDSSDRIISGP